MSRVDASLKAILDRRDTPINLIWIKPHTAHGLMLQAGRVVESYYEQRDAIQINLCRIGWNIIVELGLWNNVEIDPT